MDEIIRFRNALAHGKIIIDYNTNIVKLRYFNSNKNETVDKIITPEFIEELRGKIKQAILNFHNGICTPPIVCVGPEDQDNWGIPYFFIVVDKGLLKKKREIITQPF